MKYILGPKFFVLSATSKMVSFLVWQRPFVIILFSLPFSVLAAGNETDRLALLDVKYQITGDPFHSLSSWNESLHFCQWSGVKCGSRHQRVVELDLSSRKLEGRLSSHIGNLSFLRLLNLQNNTLNHEMPKELGHLFRLQKLSLQSNMFSGEIPSCLSNCSNLQVLELGGNDLTGRLPAELGLLMDLQRFVFELNILVGEVPVSYGNLSSLKQFYGSVNNLNGAIPDSIGQLIKLSVFSLGANNLSGTIPPSIYNLSSLAILSVPNNQLHGSLPSDIGITLPNLQILRMQTNQFNGLIPETITNASNLLILSLAENMFTGNVPNLPNVKNLEAVAVDQNDLGNGEDDDLAFLYPLANNTKLKALGIAGNGFAGVLPPVLSNFSSTLAQINAGRNQMRGSIPEEIGNLVGFLALGFEENQLTGTIPSSLGKLYKLNDLYLNDNKLSGSIPSSLGNLSSLGRFSLRRNNLQGSIPSSLGNCQKLLYMALAQNILTGPMPKELFGVSSLALMLDLSKNQLTGSLPQEVGKLENLASLDVSTNKLSGGIPGSLGSCLSLEILNLGNNFFQGSIPQALKALTAIQSLNLSHNNLSGQIPKYLGDFKLLNSLDLSFNEFDGEVPSRGVFGNASAVFISGNRKLCGGIGQLGLPRCSSNKSKSSRKVTLIIAIACTILGVTLMVAFAVSLYYLRRKRSQKASSGENSMWKVSFEDISKATDGFSSSNMIGAGSFGSVYKAVFQPDEKVVAVKVLNLLQKGASKSFMAECKALKNIRHRNLVKLLTACSSIDFQGNDFKALVYEFMAKGNLDEWLHPTHTTDEANESGTLSLIQRLNIAIDIASALDYLHHECHTPVVHCDLKPSNVLLDSDMTAHVGDFGLAKFVPGNSLQLLSSSQTKSTGMKGTIGYAAPEYGMGSEVSTYGDVYSYGILVMEMFTEKRPTDGLFKDGLNLHNYVKMALPDNVVEIADPVLLRANEETNSDNSNRTISVSDILDLVFKVGVSCSVEIPKERMDITDAVAELRRIRSRLLGSTMHSEPRHTDS